MAFSSEALDKVDDDRLMAIGYWAILDAESGKKTPREKFRSDAEYSVYLESLKWEKQSVKNRSKRG
jgi:hypothetical protein